MHVRFSTCIGTPIVCDSLHEVVGRIFDVLIHPDTGKVEGFYVLSSHEGGVSFLASDDIVRWGTQVHIRLLDVIFPIQERIRLQPLLEDKRKIFHQRIRTRSGKSVGVCRDIQFNTRSMRCEWLFPRKWWRWGTPIALTEVLEVTRQAIVIKDQEVPIADIEKPESILKGIDALPEIAPMPNSRKSLH